MDNMNITAAQYMADKGTNSGIKATIDGVEMSIPLDPANSHYAAALRMVEAGELTIEPYAPPTQDEIDAKQQKNLDALNYKLMEADLALKAFALIVLDEINVLRRSAGLIERTPAQLKSAHRARLSSLAAP